MIAASSISRGIVDDESAEQQHAERQPERDLDEDQARHRVEDAEALHDPDRRHDGGRDDQSREDEEVDDSRSSGVCRRCSTQPTIAPKRTMIVTDTTVRTALLMNARTTM